jgi:hypothetical protein
MNELAIVFVRHMSCDDDQEKLRKVLHEAEYPSARPSACARRFPSRSLPSASAARESSPGCR